jgi:hypothetical protein
LLAFCSRARQRELERRRRRRRREAVLSGNDHAKLTTTGWERIHSFPRCWYAWDSHSHAQW